MTDEQFRQIMGKLDRVERESGNGGCLIVLFILLLIVAVKVGACQ